MTDRQIADTLENCQRATNEHRLSEEQRDLVCAIFDFIDKQASAYFKNPILMCPRIFDALSFFWECSNGPLRSHFMRLRIMNSHLTALSALKQANDSQASVASSGEDDSKVEELHTEIQRLTHLNAGLQLQLQEWRLRGEANERTPLLEDDGMVDTTCWCCTIL